MKLADTIEIPGFNITAHAPLSQGEGTSPCSVLIATSAGLPHDIIVAKWNHTGAFSFDTDKFSESETGDAFRRFIEILRRDTYYLDRGTPLSTIPLTLQVT
jgi:hypothetical protein